MKLLTIPEAADQLGLKPATIRFWVWTRKIAYVKVGRSVKIREDTVEKLIAEGTMPVRRKFVRSCGQSNGMAN